MQDAEVRDKSCINKYCNVTFPEFEFVQFIHRTTKNMCESIIPK